MRLSPDKKAELKSTLYEYNDGTYLQGSNALLGSTDVNAQLIERFIQKVQYPQEDQERFCQGDVRRLQERVKSQRRTVYHHPLAVGEILIQLKMDADTICAGVLHDTLEDTDTTYEELVKLFGKAVADMVEGETKIANIKTMSKSVQEAETIRKMFFAMSEDIRVIIIKLADKLHNMRTLHYLKDERASRNSQ